MTDQATSIQPMEDPYKAAKLQDAFYWRMRCEAAEKDLDRLRTENERFRSCVEAVLTLRHAIGQFPETP
jgi:hypothetical protein